MKRRTVLVVDDCDLSQMVAQMEIAQFDPAITVLEAYDGLEALELLARMERQPDFIFLDINMPRMNGHEFLAKYTEAFASPANIAMLSSSDLTDDQERASAYPCVTHYFTKPFSRKMLTVLDDRICEQPLSQSHLPQVQ